MVENKDKQGTRKWWEYAVKALYVPVFQTKNKKKLGALPEGEKGMAINQSFLDDFLEDTREGKRWCEEAAMHWAEVLTFSFSQMIITFDLGILAFIGVMRESFFNQPILILSIIYASASLLILTAFTRSVIVKNINSLAERVRILNYTIVLAPHGLKNQDNAESAVELWEKQGDSLRKNLDGLNDHVRIWMPLQKIGVDLFYGSVLAVLVGILLGI